VSADPPLAFVLETDTANTARNLFTMRLLITLLFSVASLGLASAVPSHSPSPSPSPTPQPTNITQDLFDEFATLSELVDIAYCVGTLNTGIDAPFTCLSYCAHFPSLTLITAWNTGLTLSDSCGYIALSPDERRIIIAFRGTYSLVNALADLSLARQEYLPYPDAECDGCTVHAGFLESWVQTEKIIGSVVGDLLQQYPGYKLELVGHSLGAAVAALAALDFSGRSWDADIKVTTFGEPKGGNNEFAGFLDRVCLPLPLPHLYILTTLRTAVQ